MKKTILVILIAFMVATPCFAQEVEPEGIFTIGGTIWQTIEMCEISLFPFEINFPIEAEVSSIGFYGGEVYSDWSSLGCFYIDMLVCSVFRCGGFMPQQRRVVSGILFPSLGVGIVGESWMKPYGEPFRNHLTIQQLNKADDNWTPPDYE